MQAQALLLQAARPQLRLRPAQPRLTALRAQRSSWRRRCRLLLLWLLAWGVQKRWWLLLLACWALPLGLPRCLLADRPPLCLMLWDQWVELQGTDHTATRGTQAHASHKSAQHGLANVLAMPAQSHLECSAPAAELQTQPGLKQMPLDSCCLVLMSSQ